MTTDTDRLEFLIENEAYVSQHMETFTVFKSAWGDDEEMTPYNRSTGGCGWGSPREAIDAAMGTIDAPLVRAD